MVQSISVGVLILISELHVWKNAESKATEYFPARTFIYRYFLVYAKSSCINELMLRSREVRFIYQFFSRFFRPACRNMRLSLYHRHKIIISSDQRGSDDERVSRGGGPPRNYLISARELAQGLALSSHFLSHPIPLARRFFLPLFLAPFLTEKAFSSPPLLRDLRLLRGSSRIRASPHPPCENKGGRDARRNLGINFGEIILLRAQGHNLKMLERQEVGFETAFSRYNTDKRNECPEIGNNSISFHEISSRSREY